MQRRLSGMLETMPACTPQQPLMITTGLMWRSNTQCSHTAFSAHSTSTPHAHSPPSTCCAQTEQQHCMFPHSLLRTQHQHTPRPLPSHHLLRQGRAATLHVSKQPSPHTAPAHPTPTPPSHYRKLVRPRDRASGPSWYGPSLGDHILPLGFAKGRSRV